MDMEMVETGMGAMGQNMSTNDANMMNMSDMNGMGGMNMDGMMGGMDGMMGGMDGMDGMMGGMDGMMGGMNGMMGGMGGMMGMMKMYFNFALNFRVLFFDWYIQTRGQLVGSCIGVFLLAVIYEGLKVFRQYLLGLAKPRRLQNVYDTKETGSGSVDFQTYRRPFLSRMLNGYHLLQSFLHIIQTTLGMFLMLIYMTYNIWLAIMVSLGAGVGYFLFGALIPIKPNFGDHCA